MGFRDWIVHRLGGNAPVGDPDALVEVGLVETWQSELVRKRLAEAGIPAQVIDESSAHGSGQHIRPMSKLIARRRHYPAALEVLTGVQHDDPTDVAWPPVTRDPWAPPRPDGAQP